MEMPFGKYQGAQVDTLPIDYLKWMYETIDLRGRLRLEVQIQLVRNGYLDPLPGTTEPTTDRIKAAYRQAAKEFHPDHGGSHEAMKAVNRFYELIQGAGGC